MDRKLYECAAFGDIEILHSIVSREDLKRTTPQENTALHIAAKRGNGNFVKEILKVDPHLLKEQNFKGNTALHEAARRGYVDVVNALLGLIHDGEGQHPVAKDVEGLEYGEILEFIHIQNVEGNSALHDAAKGGHGEVVSILLKIDEESACCFNEAGETPLFKACEEGHLSVVKQLLKSSPALQYHRHHDQRTILHAALLGAHTDVAGYLLEMVPEVTSIPDKFGSTPLHVATSAEAEHMEIVEDLLEKDSSACYKFDGNGMTPLHIAASRGHASIVREILIYRPDCIEQADQKHQRNILHLAVENDQQKVVRYLLRKKRLEINELINEPESNGNTPLHLAVMKDSLEMVNLLLAPSPSKTSLAFNLKSVNKVGHTALDITQLKGGYSFAQLRIWKVLKEAGATHSDQITPSEYSGTTATISAISQSNYKAADKSLTRMAETLSVVAALIATVTFAAAFTVPGGVHEGEGGDEGIAVFINRTVFKVFVISDTVAMCSSMIVALILVWAVPGVPGLLAGAVEWGLRILWVALGGMVVTFVTAIYLVVAPRCLWLAVLVCVMGSCTPFLVSPLVIDSAKRNVHKAGFRYATPQ